MSKPNPVLFLGLFTAIIAVLGGAALMKGGLYVGKHEGDTYHLIEIVARMAAGQLPHRDFMTPLGTLAFAPIVLFVKAGSGIGMAVLQGQVLFALGLLPAVWWVAISRLSPRLALAWGFVVLMLVLALVSGEAQRSVSISMHYNRWAWAVSFVAITAALLPPVHRQSALADGIVVGLAMAALLMIKVTYFAAFAVPVVLALALTGQRRALVLALLTGVAAMAVLTLWLGPDHWRFYIGDLLTVARSSVRPAPGEPLDAIYGAPAYLGGSLVAIAGVILLRQARVEAGGLVLLVLFPAFAYVTYQNFGNDPQWLMLEAVLLLALRPGPEVVNGWGWNLRQALTVTGAVAAALIAPSFFNLAYSPFRQLAINTADYAPLLPDLPGNTDIQTPVIRALRVDVRVGQDDPGEPFAAFHDQARRDARPEFKGESFDFCTTELGLPVFFETMTRDLESAGYGHGQRIFAADLFSSFWLFGDFQPLEHGAPWYYGGLPGWQSADFLLVPICPVAQDIQAMILKALTDAGEADKLTEVRRTPLYILYAKRSE